MYQATITSSLVNPQDYSLITVRVTFDDGQNPIDKTYNFSSATASDDAPTAIQADLDLLNASDAAATALVTPLQDNIATANQAISQQLDAPSLS